MAGIQNTDKQLPPDTTRIQHFRLSSPQLVWALQLHAKCTVVAHKWPLHHDPPSVRPRPPAHLDQGDGAADLRLWRDVADDKAV